MKEENSFSEFLDEREIRNLMNSSDGKMEKYFMTFRYNIKPLYLAFIFFSLVVIAVRSLVGIPITLDNVFFAPISYFFKNNGYLYNDVVNPFEVQYFNWHGFLQPYIVAVAIPGATWASVDAGLGVLAAILILLCTFFLKLLNVSTAYSLAILIIVLALILDYRFRPELLSAILSIIFMYNAIISRNKEKKLKYYLVAGILIGAMFCTHPAVFLFFVVAAASIFVFDFEGEENKLKPLGWAAASAVAVAVSISVLVYFVHGFGIINYIDGIVTHSKTTMYRNDNNIALFFSNRSIPGVYLLLYIIPIPILFLIIKKIIALQGYIYKTILIILCLLQAYLVYRLSIRLSPTYYNFTGIAPALLVASSFVVFREKDVFESSYGRYVARTHAISLFVVSFVALGSVVLQFSQFSLEYYLSRENNNILENIMSSEIEAGHKVCAEVPALRYVKDFSEHRKLILASDETKPMRPEKVHFRRVAKGECDVYIAVAQRAGEYMAPSISGYRVEVDRFDSPLHIPFLRPIGLRFSVHRPE